MDSALKTTVFKRQTRRFRRVSRPMYATDRELNELFNLDQLELPFGQCHTNGISKTSNILDVTGRTDTSQSGCGFAGQYCFCKGGCE